MEACSEIQERLKVVFAEPERRYMTGLLAERYLHLRAADLYLDRPAPANADWTGLWQAVDELRKGRPLQYVVGECEFFGLPLYTTPAALIPRPETEELTEWALKDLSHHEKIRVLDLCTGSGCIAIALAVKIPEAEVWAADISLPALDLARRNAERNHTRINFLHCDVLDEEQMSQLFNNQYFDAIISNPPYLTQADKSLMASNVLDYEPHIALFPEADPVIFYRHIARFARQHLTSDGGVYFEINESLPDATCAAVREQGFDYACLRKDLRGKWRMLSATTRSRSCSLCDSPANQGLCMQILPS